MKKMMVLARTVPWPLDRGERIRLKSFLDAFRQVYKVTWYSLVSGTDDYTFHGAMKAYPDVMFKRINISGGSGLNIKQQTIYPMVVKNCYDFSVINFFNKIIVNGGYSTIFIKGLQFIPWVINPTVARYRDRINILFDLDDIESKKQFRLLKTMSFGRGGYFIKSLIDCILMNLFERKNLKLFDNVFVTSELDKIELEKKLGLNNLEVVKNCVPLNECKFNNSTDKSILFLGSLGYDPNEDAVKYFLDQIFPLILRKDKDVKFNIAGPSPPLWVKKRHDGKSIFVLGYVKDLQQLFNDNSIMIVPLRIGGGTRLKILDAAVHFTPVVSTSIGNEGLFFEHNKHLFIADFPEQFANYCVMLLNDKSKRKDLAKNAMRIVENFYSFESVKKDIVTILNDKY